MAAKKQAAAQATKPARRPRALPFDPASLPVKGGFLRSFKVSRRSYGVYFSELDGVCVAAVEISEKHVANYLKSGKAVAYVNGPLSVLLGGDKRDMEVIEAHERKRFDAGQLRVAMGLYAEEIGKPREVQMIPYENVSGTPFDLYVSCDDAADFDKIDAAVAREYAAILKSNAKAVKSPQEVAPLFIENAEGRTTEEVIVHFAWTAQEHQKRADAAYKEAIRRSNIFKAKQGLEKVDHYHPAYRAFTAPVFDLYIEHREHAKRARSLMRAVTETYIGKLEDERDALPF